MVDTILVMEGASQRCVNRAVAKNSNAVWIGAGMIVKAKVGTGTPVAVEVGDIVTFGRSGIEETKAILVFYHVFKLEILDDLLRGKVACCEFSDKIFMFVGVGLEPLGVCHKGIIAKKLGEIL